MGNNFRLLAVAMGLALFAIPSVAQERGMGQRKGGYPGGAVKASISGQVVDSTSKGEVEFANIALYRLRDSSLVTGTISDDKGYFTIDKIRPGKYFLKVKFLGYRSRLVGPVMLSPRNPKVNVGTIAIMPASENLEAVVVRGEKKMLLYNLDKKVVNVSKDIATQGGSAIDVLQNVPSVDVDIDGNVSLRGSENVTILIDGRPSNLTSLDELPAQMIESIEVVTNPSARYDPDGVSGIINIVMKKKREPGYNGMVSLMAGTKSQYNGSVSFNVRRNRLNVFSSISVRGMHRDVYSIMDRTSIFGENRDSLAYLAQNSNGLRQGTFGNVKGGFDFFINPSTTLTFTGNLFLRDFNRDEYINTDNTNSYSTFASNSNRASLMDFGGLGQEYSLFFKRTFDTPGKEWTADLFFSRFGGSMEDNITENGSVNAVPLAQVLERSDIDTWNNTFTLQTDFVLPAGNGGRVETGVKALIRRSDSDNRYDVFNSGTSVWEFDTDRSNRFIYDEQLYSAYGIYSNTFSQGKFSYQLGVRLEEHFTRGDQRTTGEINDTARFNIFPTAHIRWEPDSRNSFQLSYSRRLNRPRSWFLNPFLNTSDKYNHWRGNPLLEPEYTSSYDISYSLNLPKTKFSASVFFRNTKNGFSRRVTLVDPVTTLSTYINLSRYESFGIEGVVTQKITPWWSVNANYSYYATKLYGDVVSGADQGNAWLTKLTSFFNIGKSITLQVNANYRSPVLSAAGTGRGFHGIGGAQGETKEIYWVDFGAKVNVLNRRGTISVRVSDLFETRKFRLDSWDTNFTSYSERWHDSRMVYVGFSYRINNYRSRRDRKHETDNGSMDMM